MASRAVLLTAAGLGATFARAELTFPDVPQGNIKFSELEGMVCGKGTQAYYGFMGGEGDAVGKKFFLEIMGGAVCFNKESCNDDWLGEWMDIKGLLMNKFGVDEPTWGALSQGLVVPTVMPLLADKAYFPVIKSEGTNPFNKAPGIFFPTCTADIMMGRHDLTYEDANSSISDHYEAHHHGGLNLNLVMQAIKRTYPNLEEFLIMGGSGGGVSSSVWMSKIAEMWPNAQVTALVDSGFHMFPGSSFARFYYDNVEWSNGPGGDNKGRLPMPAGQSLPDMAWTSKFAIVDDLKAHSNLRVAYIACNQDRIVDSDRLLMNQYSSFDGTAIQQAEEMWDFLTLLDQCAPMGRALSYVGDCSEHHLTKGSVKSDANLPNTITLSTFVNNFLAGAAPDAQEVNRSAYWFESQTKVQAAYEGLVGDCSDNDLQNWDGYISQSDCQQHCTDNPQCAGITYHTSKGWCYTKSTTCSLQVGACSGTCFWRKVQAQVCTPPTPAPPSPTPASAPSPTPIEIDAAIALQGAGLILALLAMLAVAMTAF